ncbi:MAG TPA: CPBP family intramembrane glutamic endopeptidase [Treponemataceae bacterium]|nr:CPBP family intramembrane glutamic endopeptidase [Treponemataceae bacterium]
MKYKKKCILIIVVFACIGSSVCGQATDAKKPLPHFTRNQVLLFGGIPYVSFFGALGSLALVSEQYVEPVLHSTLFLATIPHIILDPIEGGFNTALSGIALAGGLGLNQLPGLYGDASVNHLLTNISMKYTMWSYYQGYAKARSMAEAGEYEQNLEVLSFADVFKSCYDPTVLLQPPVYVPLLVETALITGFSFLGDRSSAVWNTGESYIGSSKVPILTGLIAVGAVSFLSNTFTGIGEEALFRGVGYEEMKISFGLLPAKIVDAVLFSSVHIPQEIMNEAHAGEIATMFAYRSLTTLGLQWAYDKGGLRSSAALHTWINGISSIIGFLCTSGTENEQQLSLNFTFNL